MGCPAEALQEALPQRSGSFLSQIVEKAGFSGTPIMGQGPSFSRVAKARLATGNVHDFVKVGNIGFLERLLHRIPGIVDDDIDRAVRLLDSGGEGFDRSKITKVELCGFRQGANRRRSISRRSDLRPASTTSAPEPARQRAIARPSPLPPPVTSARCPSSRNAPCQSGSPVGDFMDACVFIFRQ